MYWLKFQHSLCPRLNSTMCHYRLWWWLGDHQKTSHYPHPCSVQLVDAYKRIVHHWFTMILACCSFTPSKNYEITSTDCVWKLPTCVWKRGTCLPDRSFKGTKPCQKITIITETRVIITITLLKRAQLFFDNLDKNYAYCVLQLFKRMLSQPW